jgi:2-polyprenyl-3-methyl-5-hydroxy-6-metoxy-1,4-benzoquinol methylase
MLELVGRDKRVLDVGCATGYLARAMAAQGCTVSGVEVDTDAAAEARPVLKDLVVGDLQHLDLTDTFGERAFDAVVFGDVLEHLTDPLKLLRASIGLLDEGGFVVVSIPNIAHGSVRLSLLKGRFEYQSLGLLDSTHVRFFTLESLEALFRDAELIPVDFRRTTAGFFETEIPLKEEDYSAGLLAALNNEPEARTYQFVVKAIPVDSSPALRRMYEENAQQKAELTRLRRIVDAVRPAGFEEPPAVQVGVWGHFGLEDLRMALLARIVPGELARRFPSGSIRRFAPTTSDLRIEAGRLMEGLGPWSRGRAELLAAELDAVVVTGPVGLPPSIYGDGDSSDQLTEPDAILVHGLGEDLEESCPVLSFGVEMAEHSPLTTDQLSAALAKHRFLAPSDRRLADVGIVGQDLPFLPDPVFLVGRYFSPEALRLRAAYLRLMGWFPDSGPVIVIQGDRDLIELVPPLAKVIDEVAATQGARCVAMETKVINDDASFANSIAGALKGPCGVIPIDAGIMDLVAAVANADIVITSSATLMAVAFAVGRPCVGLDLHERGQLRSFAEAARVPDAIVRRPTEIMASIDHWPTREVLGATLRSVQGRLDEEFDQVAEVIAEVARARRASDEAPSRLLSLATQLKAAQAAYEGLERRMAAERHAFGVRAATLEEGSADDLRRAKVQIAELREMIDAIYATRTMRTLKPARELYSRLRSRTR